MKNIHVLSTDKPSNLYFHKLSNKFGFSTPEPMTFVGSGSWAECRNIYITSDEEIKIGDWVYSKRGFIGKFGEFENSYIDECKKIILTTDQDLIKDGVQAIDDEFLEWFVKNPSCDKVEIEYQTTGLKVGVWQYDYKIIIPKEENFKHELHELSKEEVLANRSSAYEFIDFDKQENCCTPIGQIKRYKDCIGCDRKPKQETLEEAMNQDGYQESDYDKIWREGVEFGAKWQQERMYSEMDIVLILSKFRDMKMIAFSEWFEQFKNK